MPPSIRELILNGLPEDGSEIESNVLRARLQEVFGEISSEAYQTARDALLADGLMVIETRFGRGDFLALATDDDPEAENDDDDLDGVVFELAAEEFDQSSDNRGSARKLKRPKKTQRKSESVQVLSYRHTETRVNNPEVGMVNPENDPDQPKAVWRYDPHLNPELMFDSQRGAVEKLIDHALASGDADSMREALIELKRLQEPFLNWAGKAEGTSFAVDTVSLHVHERVDPATILSNARKRLKGENASEEWRQADLFAAAFENLPLRQALDFYRHEKGWSNRLVSGDSLLVMNSLLQKESMTGKVQMIYIDPPYGIKYGSNFQPFTNKRDVKDGADADLTNEPEMIKAFRDTWELGIHSYLTYLRDRLLLARELLHESGSVFVQISDENVHHVREIMDEVIGAENFVSMISFVKTTSSTSNDLSGVYDILLWYGKARTKTKYRGLFLEKQRGAEGATGYTKVRDPAGNFLPASSFQGPDGELVLPDGFHLVATDNVTSQSPGSRYGVDYAGKMLRPEPGYWKTDEPRMQTLIKSGRVAATKNLLAYVRRFDDFPVFPMSNIWTDTLGQNQFGGSKVYAVQTSISAVQRCILMTTDPGDLVFDPTCGSGTTAFVAEKWGRRWITCDTSRIAITLAKQRLMTASFDYFSLRYPHEGVGGGFAYVTVPHVTLKSIVNNPEINAIYAARHPAVESALEALNKALVSDPPRPFKPSQGYRKGKPVSFSTGEALKEWEVPFEIPDDWSEAAAARCAEFNAARHAMQSEIDRSIFANAEPETLYDKPEVDKSRIRITGPFSVEAVPAPTVLSLDGTAQTADADNTVARSGETSRQTQWRDELIRTGIRAKGGAMLKFTDLEAIPGVQRLHASGTLDSGERVVISFGPEHAALEQKQVERAIEDAQTLVPKPKFVVFCAFTFDPEAAKDIDELNWPGVTLLKAQMNTDLLTEDLKKARSSNQSFWLMGQPEVELKQLGKNWQVEVHGFDYFDPREGTLVSGGKSKIAMWSLDTDYDGRSLMPQQVFFPMAGGKDGWNRLKKTIRAELDEELLEQFHGTLSLPFEAGDHRRVAIKIVDDRGIESLKIMNLE